MSEEKKAQDNQRNPLPNHKKIKNRMVPSFLTQIPMEFTRYIDDVLPEIIGIALLHDALGYRRGAEIALEISRFLNELGDIAFPLVSVIGGLSDSDKKKFVERMDKIGASAEISTAFTPLNEVLGNTPLNFIERNNSIESEVSHKYLRTCVDRHFSRYSHTTSAALATLYYTQAVIGKIHVASNLRMPDLDAIIGNPESEEALKSKADVRIFSLMAIGQLKQHKASDWPKIFWKRCLASSPCEYWNPNDDPEPEC